MSYESEAREIIKDMAKAIVEPTMVNFLLRQQPELTCTVMRRDHECGRPGVLQLLPDGDEIRCAKDIDVPEQF